MLYNVSDAHDDNNYDRMNDRINKLRGFIQKTNVPHDLGRKDFLIDINCHYR